MSDKLIRKSGLIDTLNGWLSGEPSETLFGIGYDGAVRDIIKLIQSEKPVNAVELPCKVGDTVFTTYGGRISENRVERITFFKNRYLLTVKDFYLGNGFVIDEWDIDPNEADDGQYTFFTREEAEKALEDLKNENK